MFGWRKSRKTPTPAPTPSPAPIQIKQIKTRRPARPVATAVEAAEQQLEKMKILPKVDMNAKLNAIVFESDITLASKDVLRLVRRITFVFKDLSRKETIKSLLEVAGEAPESLSFSKDPLATHLLLTLLRQLVDFFDYDLKEFNAKVDELIAQEDIKVLNLIQLAGGEKSKVGMVLKCLSQGVIITGHTVIKTRVCTLPTKDVSDSDGWTIQITLAKSQFVRVKQARREIAIDKFKWELNFAVYMTFDSNMSEMTRSSLEITGLNLPQEGGDEDMRKYLKEKFGNGQLVVV